MKHSQSQQKVYRLQGNNGNIKEKCRDSEGKPPLPLIFAAEAMGSEQQLQKLLHPVITDVQGKKGTSKEPFAEHNSEFVSEHEEAEESPPQLRTARRRNELEEKVKRGLK